MKNIILLLISTILMLLVNIYIRKSKSKNQLIQIFSINFVLIILWNISLILQICFSNNNSVQPIWFDYIAYIGICFLPISLFFTGKIFANTKIKFKKTDLLLLVIPVISLLVLWTNNLHHLFYKYYSTNINDCIYGPYIYIHQLYSYITMLIGVSYLIRYSIKNSGFFSRQSLLIIIGMSISILINVLGSFQIIPISIYITPISFTITILLIAIAIFKFDFLKVVPIALQRIVDKISDAYIVVNENYIITDFNQSFLNIFNANANIVRNKDLLALIEQNSYLNINPNALKSSLDDVKDTDGTAIFEKHFDKIDKYFHIEINRIMSKGNFLGILILLKDVTQHTIDMKTIQDNQEMLVEKERLASLGQMIGGIAHNLKTPIMSIAGATEGISDLIKEYESSVGDPEVTVEDHHEIAQDMNEWLEKIKTHLSYMSDVITAIKGQAVAFSEQTASGFTVKELINYVDILMKHELKNALINLNTQADIDTSTTVRGNINSLVQVINNIISNSIQAYQSQGKSNENINFRVYKENDNIIFKIEDFAGGLPDKVKDKLFKEMITTKGKNGTGLGLFMSYSNIRAHFGGTLKYDTQKGKGTSFFVEIPL